MKDTLALTEIICVVGFFIDLNSVDVDLDSTNYPQISHIQELISGIFISLVKASYTTTYFSILSSQHPVCGDMNWMVLILSFNIKWH